MENAISVNGLNYEILASMAVDPNSNSGKFLAVDYVVRNTNRGHVKYLVSQRLDGSFTKPIRMS